MSSIDDIRQLPQMDPQKWPNDLHIGYYIDQQEYIDATFDVETPAPALLEPYITEFKTALTGEDRAYRIPNGSELTELIAAADQERDALLAQVRTMIDAYKGMAALPVKQQAAQTMRTLWDVYKPDPEAAYERETTAINQWHDDFAASPTQVAAAAELGLTDIIAQLMVKNQLVHQLINQRAAEQQRYADLNLKSARALTDTAFRHFTMMLNALALTSADPHEFEPLIISLSGKQAYYQQLYDDARRANRRVSVKSELVGNRRYAASAGWTWATLAEHNAADLALDPTPSEPGVEPVVTAVRIVSLDPKARRAGGLAVAEAGQIVNPSDLVDTESEYELVAYSPEPEP